MGGCPINLNDTSKFLHMINQASLSDLGYIRGKYTWSNNRLRGSAIAERLDRALGNNEWVSKFLTKVEHLNRTCSNHFPLLITLSIPSVVEQTSKLGMYQSSKVEGFHFFRSESEGEYLLFLLKV